MDKIAYFVWSRNCSFPFPMGQKNSSTLQIATVISIIDLMPSDNDTKAKHFIGNEVTESNILLVPTYFGNHTAPLYDKSYFTKSDQNKLHPAMAQSKPFDASYAYIRSLHGQLFEKYSPISITHLDLFTKINVAMPLHLNFKFEAQNDLALNFIAHDSTYFQGNKFDEVYTSSFLKDDIQFKESGKKIYKIKLLKKKTFLNFLPDHEIARFNMAYEDDLHLPELMCGQIEGNPLELSILDSEQTNFFKEYRCDAKHLEFKKPILETCQVCPDLKTDHLENCQTQKVEKPDHSMFARHLVHDQEGELLSYQALVKDSVPKGYYLLPHLNLTGPILLTFGVDKPELIETIALGNRACIREMARGRIKTNV